MRLILKYNQIYTTVSVAYQEMSTDISNVLIDTGSATSILAVDDVTQKLFSHKAANIALVVALTIGIATAPIR